jgi:choline kinase
MKALILAAGRGSRMGTLTDDRPKGLMTLRGRTLLDWQLSALREAGITQVGLITGYRRELLSHLADLEFHNPRWAQTNMVSSLRCAQGWLAQETCIVSYSDIVYSADAVRSLASSTADLAVAYDPHWLELWTRRFGDPLLDAETFRMDPEGALAEIGQKPGHVSDVQGQYMGLLRFTPRAWSVFTDIHSALPPDRQDRIHMTGMLQHVIDSGRLPVAAVPYSGEWGEFDTAQDLRLFARD